MREERPVENSDRSDDPRRSIGSIPRIDDELLTEPSDGVVCSPSFDVDALKPKRDCAIGAVPARGHAVAPEEQVLADQVVGFTNESNPMGLNVDRDESP